MQRFIALPKWVSVLAVSFSAIGCSAAPDDPLSSWNDGASKQAIVEFVESVTDTAGPDFVPSAERIAVFDNDGTLWAEQPIYFQLVFVLDRIKALAPEHPEWSTTQPFKAALEGDMQSVLAGGEQAIMVLLMATHTGMTESEFSSIVGEWLSTARHPTTGRMYSQMVYQPMLELLSYLRANDFKTYITSGGGISFMRPFTEEVYGIPPEQVIGSSIKARYEYRDGSPVLDDSLSCSLSMIRKASLSLSITTSGDGLLLPSATRTATCRCCSGLAPAMALVFACMCITRMLNASGLTITSPTLVGWTRGWIRPARTAGPLSI